RLTSAGSAAQQPALATEALLHDRLGPARDRLDGGLAPLHRLLLGVMLDEVAGLAPELEHRHLTLAPLAEPEGDDRGADAGADVDRAFRFPPPAVLGVPARSVEPMNVTMAGDHPDRELVQPR